MPRPVDIGNVRIQVPIGLAPLAGVTDHVFRWICKEQGAGLVCTEMVSAKAIVFKNKNTFELLRTDDKERPSAVQLFGSDPAALSEAAAMIRDLPFDLVDFNMGCPVPKIVKNHEGSALMTDQAAAEAAIRALVDSAGKPVTVKMRAGFSASNINAVTMAKAAEDCGAAAVTIHGRTREQYYSGKADWDIIRKVKEAVGIPVFGNGDVTDGRSALEMLRQTGCDGILVGRGAMGDPWVFSRIIRFLEKGTEEERPPKEKVIPMIIDHARLLAGQNGEYQAVRQMRSHAAWYIKGFRNAAKIRGLINNVETLEELEELFQRLS